MTTDREQKRTGPYQAADAPVSDALLKSAVPPWLLTLAALALAAGLYALSRINYLLFHVLVEFFFVAVAFTVYSIGWNSRKYVRNNALMILSTAYLVIGSVGLLHLIAYRGMGVLPGIETNIATQLWLAARFLEAAAFLAAAIAINRRTSLSPWVLLGTSVGVGLLLLVTIWPLRIFPVCYIEGIGLTPFKVISEHVISVLFGLAILLFWQRRDRLDVRIIRLLTAAIVFAILAELSFTLYEDVYGIANFLGHFFKFVSVVLLYRVLVIGTLRSPYATLFHDLIQAKEKLDLELVQRRRIEADLLAANRELDAFVRTVSHDLRSPLTPIIGLPELLLEQLRGRLDDESRKSLQDIREQGLRMARILEDLLDFARAGRLIDGVASDRLEAVVNSVLEDLGSRVIASGVTIDVGDLPDVRFPRTALFQIFSNLVGNAIKYAGAGGSPIEIGADETEEDVILYVRDHGPGVEEADREHIFDVFYRGRRHRETPGTGVGLATVFKIAQCLGGDAWVEETPGGGSTFRVSLKKSDPDRQQTLRFPAS